MATNFYTFYAIMSGKTVLELCQSRKEANDGMPYWNECQRRDAKIKKITIEAVSLNGKIYLPLSWMPELAMWLKEKQHGVEYAYNIA